MIKTIKTEIILLIAICIAITSCSLNKEIVNKLEINPIVLQDFPIDYQFIFPDTTSFDKWDSCYNVFDKYLTKEIMQTQMGLTFVNNGVNIWTCFPSAHTHVQLDTSTMIADKKSLIGEWRMVTNRRIKYEDSVSYSDKKIYRNAVINFDNKDDDVYLLITDKKFSLYAKMKGKNTFKRYANKNYDIQRKRYLMLFGISKASSAISQIGLDKEGRLIHNTYFVQERKIKDKYIVYQSTITQVIYKRLDK